MKRIIQKQEAQHEVLGMPLLGQEYSRVGSERDLSEILDEADMQHKRLLVRPFLDFKEEEQHLRNVVMYEKKGIDNPNVLQGDSRMLLNMAEPLELSEEYILKTYALSKRKEHALSDALTDEKIRIFCSKDGQVMPNNN